jgi:hypothetical protein
MKSFTNGQRVIVAADDHELNGMLGTVKRLRLKDDGAWVDMDGPLPVGMRKFPEDDQHGRGNHQLLFPEDCEPAP